MRGAPKQNVRALLEQDAGHPIGRVAAIPAASGELVSLLDLSGDDPTAELVTVAFSVVAATSSSSLFGANMAPNLVHASLSFGTGGANARAWVTLGRGLQLTVPATGLKIGAQRVLDQGGNNPALQVQAWCAYGSRPSNNSPAPYFEQRIIGLNPASSVDVPIPPFAWTVSVVASNAVDFIEPPNDAVIEAIASGAVIAQFGARVYAPFFNIPLPSQAETLRITAPAGASAPLNLSVMYGLAL